MSIYLWGFAAAGFFAVIFWLFLYSKKYNKKLRDSRESTNIQQITLDRSGWRVKDKNPDRIVALVTKDMNLRLKAKALRIDAQDYLTDKITEERVENIKKEVIILEKVSQNIIDRLFSNQKNYV